MGRVGRVQRRSAGQRRRERCRRICIKQPGDGKKRGGGGLSYLLRLVTLETSEGVSG